MDKELILKQLKVGLIAISYDTVEQADKVIMKFKELGIIKQGDVLMSEYPNLDDIDYRVTIFPVETEWMFVPEYLNIETMDHEEFLKLF